MNRTVPRAPRSGHKKPAGRAATRAEHKKRAGREALAGREVPLSPGLYLAATPIGNAGDVTLRALDILRRAEVILCEDTRSAARLMTMHGIRRRGRLRAYNDHSGERERAAVLKRIEAGAAVALVSEAGTPLVSDPGYKLARAAMERGVAVTCAPGACAAVAALSVSGLASDRFFFAGFPPSRAGGRRRFLETLREVPGTLIFYESRHRLAACLRDMAEVLGEREAALARELTKRFEEVRRGALPELAREIGEGEEAPKGEMVVLVAGASGEARAEVSDAEVEARLRELTAAHSPARAARMVKEETGLARSRLYRRALALRREALGEAGE